jgi:hypothetical protein
MYRRDPRYHFLRTFHSHLGPRDIPHAKLSTCPTVTALHLSPPLHLEKMSSIVSSSRIFQPLRVASPALPLHPPPSPNVRPRKQPHLRQESLRRLQHRARQAIPEQIQIMNSSMRGRNAGPRVHRLRPQRTSGTSLDQSFPTIQMILSTNLRWKLRPPSSERGRCIERRGR